MKVAIVIDIFRLRKQLVDSNAIVCVIADIFRETLPHIDITRLKFISENNSCVENLKHIDKFDFERIEKLVYYLFSTGPFSNMVDIEVIDYKIDYSYMLVVLEGKEVNK